MLSNERPHDIVLEQQVSFRYADYEPGGREFESLRARHLIKGLESNCSLALF